VTDIKVIVKEEVDKFLASVQGEITDPGTKAAITRMTNDMAMLPIRMSQGEDVTVIFASLQAEAAMRGVAVSLKAQTMVQQVWINILTRVISIALSAI